MTVIAVRDGIMAADSRNTVDGHHYRCDKLFRIRGMLVGVAGDNGPSNALIEYLRAGEPESGLDKWNEQVKGGSALVLCHRRGILHYEESTRPDIVREPFFAIGLGAGVALGSMERGASAAQAVKAACRWNVNCGLPVQTLSLKGKR